MARILIVDDEPLIAEIAEEWLAELGHAVVGPAYDLKTALSLADGDLDAAILDVSLGRNDSYPVADRLKARGARSPSRRAMGWTRPTRGAGASSSFRSRSISRHFARSSRLCSVRPLPRLSAGLKRWRQAGSRARRSKIPPPRPPSRD